MEFRSIVNRKSVLAAIYLALRYYAAFTLLSYGFGKLMGSQFTIIDAALAKPMGEVSGFWLTWYYFGYSPVYANIIALTQIGGSILLCFRRTALLGAFVLLPVMVNIVCVDVWVIQFPLRSGALLIAFYVLAALVIICGFHAREFFRFFLRRREDWALFSKTRWWLTVFQVAVVLGMVAYSGYEGYWLANFNNRAPTPIDGAWHVVSEHPNVPGLPDWIYFEYNRAHMVNFHYPDGRFAMHDFRVDVPDHKLFMSQRWLEPGGSLFEGTWTMDGDILKIAGLWNKSGPITLILKRKQMPVKDHE
jgi:hypothetical protein